MSRLSAITAPIVLLLALAIPARAAAIAVDGRPDPAYGPPLSTRTTQTPDDNHSAGIDVSRGSELDQAFATVSDGTLYGMAGLKFDDGFNAGWWLSGGGDLGSWPTLSAYAAALPVDGGGTGQFLGNTLCGGNGALSGGTNPFGIGVAVVASNTLGVTQGCGPASGAGVTTGIEWAIPLAAIGDPTGCIRICAIDACGDHSCTLNQTLGPLPPGTCGTPPTSSVDFSATPGDQFFTVCPGATPTPQATW